LLEEAGEFAQAILPGGAVDHQAGGEEAAQSRLFREKSGSRLFFGANLLLGLDLHVAIERLGVAAVGSEPGTAGKASPSSVRGSGTVVRALLRWSPCVLSSARAETNLHVGDAAAALVHAVMAPNCAAMAMRSLSETA